MSSQEDYSKYKFITVEHPNYLSASLLLTPPEVPVSDYFIRDFALMECCVCNIDFSHGFITTNKSKDK